MSNSVISSLTNLLDRQAINNIALRIGESEESVSRALGPTLAAILNEMATKTNDPGVLRYMFDMVNGAPASSLSTVTIINLATSGAAGSPLFDFGRRLLPILFEGKQGPVGEAIEQTSGLSSGGAARMISMAVPVVLGFLGKRVREEGLACLASLNCCSTSYLLSKAPRPPHEAMLWERHEPLAEIRCVRSRSPLVFPVGCCL